MNPIAVLGLAAAGLGGLMLLSRDAHADDLEVDENLTFVTGDSGTQYAVAIAPASDNGQVYTVMNTDMQPLFTFLQTPGGPRKFMSSHDAEDGELAKALNDFQPIQGV